MTDEEFEKWLSEAADEGKYFAERDCVPAVEVRALFAQLRAEQRWIPVSERLPERGKEVLVLCAADRQVSNEDPRQQRIKIEEAFGDPKTSSGWRDHRRSQITHWMPLPPPGAEGGE